MLGVLPGIVGTIQTTEALKLILGIGETLVGRLLLVDALRMQFRNLKLRRDPECPACGTHELTALEDYEEFCGLRRAAAAGLAAPPIREITPREVAAKRARQINSYYHNLGEGTFDEFPPPMIETVSKNYLTIALEEVAAGKIKYHYR